MLKSNTFSLSEYLCFFINSLTTNPTKWSNTLKQFVGNLPMNCLNVFEHFVGMALKWLMYAIVKFISSGNFSLHSQIYYCPRDKINPGCLNQNKTWSFKGVNQNFPYILGYHFSFCYSAYTLFRNMCLKISIFCYNKV